jgi:hypothetical protein
MHEWGWWQYLRVGFAACLILGGPFLDLQVLRRLKANPTSAGRLWFYRACSASLVGFAVVSFVLMRGRGVWHFAPEVLAQAGVMGKVYSHVILQAMSVGFCAAIVMPGALSLFSRKFQAAYGKAYGKSDLAYLFPVGTEERRWWAILSLAAGICEELIVRGFYLQVATSELRMGLMQALVVTSAAFGLGHMYQGVGGMLKTGLVGLLLGCVAVATGGLLVPMVVHTLIDMQVLAVYRKRDEEVADGQ